MNIIRKTVSENGACGQIQSWGVDSPPDGYAEFPGSLDTAAFYAHNGFVTLTIEPVEHIRKVRKVVPVQKFEAVAKKRMVPKTVLNEYGEEEIIEVPEIYYENEPYWENEVQIVDEPYFIDTVTAYEPNVEAWEAWKASLPEPEEPEPTEEEDTSAMLIDHEYRLTMLELGLADY